MKWPNWRKGGALWLPAVPTLQQVSCLCCPNGVLELAAALHCAFSVNSDRILGLQSSGVHATSLQLQCMLQESSELALLPIA